MTLNTVLLMRQWGQPAQTAQGCSEGQIGSSAEHGAGGSANRSRSRSQRRRSHSLDDSAAIPQRLPLAANQMRQLVHMDTLGLVSVPPNLGSLLQNQMLPMPHIMQGLTSLQLPNQASGQWALQALAQAQQLPPPPPLPPLGIQDAPAIPRPPASPPPTRPCPTPAEAALEGQHEEARDSYAAGSGAVPDPVGRPGGMWVCRWDDDASG